MATNDTTTPPTGPPGGVTFYYDDGALFRERDETGLPEILNGDRWEFWPEPTSRMSVIDEGEATRLANGVPLDAENAGVSAAASAPEGDDGEA